MTKKIDAAMTNTFRWILATLGVALIASAFLMILGHYGVINLSGSIDWPSTMATGIGGVLALAFSIKRTR